MRAIFIGIFVIALLAGITAKILLHSPSDKPVFGEFLKSSGYQSEIEIQRKTIDQYIKRTAKDKASLNDYLHDQQKYYQESQQQVSSLMQMNQNLSDKGRADILRIKDLMEQFQNKNVLLIENSKQLMQYNEQRLKMNQTMLDKSEFDSIEESGNRQRLLQDIKDKIRAQEDLMKQQVLDSQELNSKIQEIKEKARQRHDDVAFKEKPEFLEKVEALSTRTQDFVDNVKQKQRQINNMHEKNISDLESMKEKMRDLKERTVNNTNQNRSLVQTQEMNQRVQDQIQRLKELRNR